MKTILIGLMAATSIFAVFTFSAIAQRPEAKPPVPAQTPAPSNEPPVVTCPKLEVKAEAQQYVRDGMPVKFTASISGGDTKVSPILSWTISAGVMTGGQGTPTIEVDSTGAGVDKAITASLLIGGFPPECTAEASATVQIAGPAKKLDEYGVVADEEETARLDQFMKNVTPSDYAYVIVYAGRTSPRYQASNDLKKIRAYLVKSGAVSSRVVSVDGGFREQPSHELWLVPIGAESPKPTPTIAAKDIVYPKPTPAVKKP